MGQSNSEEANMAVFGMDGWAPDHMKPGVLRAGGTREFYDAWKAFPELLAAVGFDGSYAWPVFYKSCDDELAALAVSEIRAAMPAWRAKRDRERAEKRAYWDRVFEEKRQRDAARAAEKAKAANERPARVKAELRALVEKRIWLLQPEDQARAIALAAHGEGMDLDDAERIVKKAAATLARAADRTSRPAKPQAMARAADPQIRDAVHEACRWLSVIDADRAQHQNSEGWGRSTTISGHYLAEQSSLTVEQAAYGLSILHTHRGQLPPELRRRLGL
jgi:hypothetical protein